MQKPPVWEKILPAVATTKNSGKIDTSNGCMFCGKSFVHLVDQGLHDAHIFPSGLGCSQAWNLIPLCPSCHQSFDQIIKPRLVHALLIGANGYLPEPDKPTKDQSPRTMAESMTKVVELLVDEPQLRKIRERSACPQNATIGPV